MQSFLNTEMDKYFFPSMSSALPFPSSISLHYMIKTKSEEEEKKRERKTHLDPDDKVRVVSHYARQIIFSPDFVAVWKQSTSRQEGVTLIVLIKLAEHLEVWSNVLLKLQF